MVEKMAIINVNDIDLYYENMGTGTPVVLVHGFGADHCVWLAIIDELCKHYRVITIDSRGSGLSDVPDHDYSIDILADDICQLLSKLNIEKAHFIGSSMGGAVLQQIGYNNPNRVISLVISNSFMQISANFGMYSKARLELYQHNLPPRTIYKTLLPWVFSSKYLGDQQRQDEIVELSLQHEHPITALGYKNQLAALLSFDSHEWIDKIKVPCLFIASEQDIISPHRDIEKMASLVQDSEYYFIPGVGHLPHTEAPQVFTERVMEFFKQYQ